nr:S16 family serine protease [Evansella caseinilytica]
MKLSKEIKISIALVAVPLVISFLLILLPVQEEYTARGEIAPVSDLGINGSVHFTYVYSGIIENYLDKFYVFLEFDDVEFITLDDDEYEFYTEYYVGSDAEEDAYKEQTVANAVHVTASEIGEEDVFQDKIDDILYHSAEYYGDSMGLMVAIGLVEEMNNVDYSRHGSLTIAGTGTLEYDGTVGSIGAVKQKLFTAAANDVDIFFIPKDEDIYGMYSNESEARQVLREENLDLNVVPVETLDDAIEYLENYDTGKVLLQ